MPEPADDALALLLETSHRLAPDELPDAVTASAALLGARAAAIFLVDYEQLWLMPFGVDDEPQSIEGTTAGRAYRNAETVVFDADGGSRLWLPLLDGSDRLGVIRLDLDDTTTPELEQRAQHLATVVAELVVSKSMYGDSLDLCRRRRDMDLAAELRWAMLPPLSFSNDRVEIAGVLEPAYEIAGDSFDYAVNGDVVHIALVDAVGHGLEASRIANLAIIAYRHSRRHNEDLMQTFRAMDLAIADQFAPERFVTGQLATLELSTGKLVFLSAGHPRPLLLRGGRCVGEIACDTSLPIGLGDVAALSAEVVLEPGDRVLFYTDGVVEARSDDGEEFGVDRLGDLATRAASAEETPAETARRLIHSVLAHEAGKLRDDATLLILGWPNNQRKAT